MDDATVLAYGKNTEEDCKILGAIRKKCGRWAGRHGAVFAPTKYELIHLSRSHKKFNTAATISIETNVIKLKTDIGVLGLQIDTKLKMGSPLSKNPGENDRKIDGVNKIIHFDLGCHIL